MNETCDRCGPAVRAVYRASRGGQLSLCGHCANQLRAALSAQGWAIWLITTPAVTSPGPRSPESHATHFTRHGDTAADLHVHDLGLRIQNDQLGAAFLTMQGNQTAVQNGGSRAR